MMPPPDAWGLVGTPRPLSGGHRNTVLQRDGHVLKTTRRSEAALRWLTVVQDAAVTAGFFVPRLLESHAGTLSLDGWTCEPFFDGASTDPKVIAPRIASLHAMTRDIPQRPGFASARDLIENPSGGDIDLTAMPERLRDAVRAAWADLPETETVAVHGDLNPANILTGRDGQIALLDWDEARRDHPAFDLSQIQATTTQIKRAAMAWEIACSWRIESEHAKALAARFLQ